MQFVKTNIGLVNLALVERIHRGSDGKAIINGGGGPAISEMSFEELEESLGIVVPNTTTSQALLMEVVDGAVAHRVTPIIAWRISGEHVTPILLTDDECSFVLLPSGQVDELFIESFETLDDAKAAFLERSKR